MLLQKVCSRSREETSLKKGFSSPRHPFLLLLHHYRGPHICLGVLCATLPDAKSTAVQEKLPNSCLTSPFYPFPVFIFSTYFWQMGEAQTFSSSLSFLIPFRTNCRIFEFLIPPLLGKVWGFFLICFFSKLSSSLIKFWRIATRVRVNLKVNVVRWEKS